VVNCDDCGSELTAADCERISGNEAQVGTAQKCEWCSARDRMWRELHEDEWDDY
jgi:hypothetical protein